MLKGKTVVVGVCGGIAAYKVVEVISRLRKLGAEVHVIMTKSAESFVAPLTFQSLSNNYVVRDMFSEPKSWEVEHISLARRADLIVIAPATANVIGKVSGGIADDMLTTTIMAAQVPVLFVPAMNQAMYANPILKSNISKLAALGYMFMEPGTGSMAAEGEHGKGRLPEPRHIVERLVDILLRDRDMKDIKVLITAGPTREAIDPVRYISNHSSGKMGYSLAEAALKRGAEVTLVSGPVSIPCPGGAELISVVSAQQMHSEVMKAYARFDMLIMVAAVADYRCAEISPDKIKKNGDDMTVRLVKNPDIARELGEVKGERLLVGFSAETENLLSNAKAKLEAKNMDMIAANDVSAEGAGFDSDTNIVKLVKRDGCLIELPKMSKRDVSHKILDEAVMLFKKEIKE
ncbi:phosphopantothenate-cysteine ligase /phosphopantothenoylcysteine decarboxylase [Anaerobacterium chartisolvens]|uniref:Coenzyme A biosynthesis bifunctional protein CoaBC n=1 Tax=Anaerobacterium chartisolvens TaxID=1297424 RepID=A0A369BBK8_9FIRM|nr:bifunctional phosphopantothenoylcysteine decarboxylase/phosphopantothenate--cysteine ligase CoaBC [Anaerobacterium chartisolvens]RCX17988.1 phosphopantothenate-cysteine ligase /phosphopantothenoylcysteine decarboxylase [Anaerobacterium chartisolvens]